MNQTQDVVKTGWTIFTTNDGLSDNWIRCLVQDKHGTIWAGSDGLSTFNGSAWIEYSGPAKISGVISAARDKDGNLWFGTGGDGVYKFTGKEWITSNDVYFGLPGTVVKNIFVDAVGNIWFATLEPTGRAGQIDYGVTRYDGK